MGYLTRHSTLFDSLGNSHVIPSGSATVGVSSSLAVSQQYVISMSSGMTSTSSSILAESNTTSSYWYFRQPDNYSFKIFYQNTSSLAVESTGSNLYSLPNYPKSNSGSVIKVLVVPGISGSHESSSIARATFNALNSHPSKINRYTVSSSYSGSGIGKFEYIHLTNLVPGLPPTDDISFKYISGSGFDYHIPVSGSGNAFGTFFPGSPDTGSSTISFLIDPNDPNSYILSGSKNTNIYMSGSGAMGFGTTNPEADFDIRSDEFKIRKKESHSGIRMNSEGNIESFNSDTNTAGTGSEIILTYTRGVVAQASPQAIEAQLITKSRVLVNDVLGSIRWVSDSGSLNPRASGEAGNIKVAVASSTIDGITGKYSINLAAEPSEPPTQRYLLNGLSGKHEFTGSVDMASNLSIAGNINVASFISASGAIVASSASIAGPIRGKSLQLYNANFKGNLGTSEVFIPLAAQPDEQTAGAGMKEHSAVIMPCSGRVREIILRQHWSSTITTSDDISWKMYTRATGTRMNGSSQIGNTITMVNPTQAEADANNTRTTGELDSTYHFDKYDALAISMQWASTGPTNNADRIYITVVVEHDWETIGY